MKTKLKGILCCAAAAAFAAFPLTACGNKGDEKIAVYMPDGAPALAMSKLMNDGMDGTSFTVVSSAAISGYVKNGTADIAVMPVNGAAALYNSGVKITMLSVNTHGNLYLVGNSEGEIGLDGLKGKRVGVIGQGQVPDITLRMLLDESEISYVVSDTVDGEKVSIKYGANGPALFPLLGNNELDFVFAAEPAVNSAVTAMGKHIVLDAQELWRDVMGGEYPQACVVTKTELVEKNSAYIKKFMTALEDADGWADENAAAAVGAVKAHMADGVTPTLADNLPEAAIARCNIKTVSAANSKTECDGYFERLTQMSAGNLGTTVLSRVPDAKFYLDASVWTNKE